jgi:hypothetical protein
VDLLSLRIALSRINSLRAKRSGAEKQARALATPGSQAARSRVRPSAAGRKALRY